MASLAWLVLFYIVCGDYTGIYWRPRPFVEAEDKSTEREARQNFANKTEQRGCFYESYFFDGVDVLDTSHLRRVILGKVLLCM